MKKIFALLLVLSMVFAFAACAGNNKNGTTTTAATTTAATTTVPTTAPTTTPTTGPDDVKVLTYAEYAAIEVEPGDDIYVTVTLNDKDYSFCVERYLTGPETDVYTAFATLTAGDVVDIEGFLYWYQGPNPHITAVAAAN